MEDLTAEVRERFGPLPPPVAQLFSLYRLRLRARESHVQDVQHSAHTLMVRFDRDGAPRGNALARWGKVFDRRISFSAVGDLEVRIETNGLTPDRLIGMLNRPSLPDDPVPSGTGTKAPEVWQRIPDGVSPVSTCGLILGRIPLPPWRAGFHRPQVESLRKPGAPCRQRRKLLSKTTENAGSGKNGT